MSKDEKSKSGVTKKPSGRREPDRLSESSISFDPEAIESMESSEKAGFVKQQLGRMQSQIDDIARVPRKERLSDNQVDTLRKYIEVKELEVRDLKDQKTQYKSYLDKLTTEITQLSQKNKELSESVRELSRQRDHLKSELDKINSHYENKLASMREESDDKLRSFGGYESKLKELKQEKEEWKEKVRTDLKKIKLKEKEIENKYELLKRDAQTLLDAKDRHALELKKKGDALEMELEASEERLRQNAMILGSIDSKKRRLIETMKLAVSLLEEIDKETDSSSAPKKKAG